MPLNICTSIELGCRKYSGSVIDVHELRLKSLMPLIAVALSLITRLSFLDSASINEVEKETCNYSLHVAFRAYRRFERVLYKGS